jgi:hypothetical protein
MMRFDKEFLAGVFAGICAGLIGAVLIFQGVIDKAHGQATTTTQLPAATVTTGVTTGTSVQVAPTNPGRRTFTICAATNSIYALPGTTAATSTNGIPIAAGTCLSPPPNALQSGTVLGGGNAWQAIGNSGTATVSFIEW